MKDISIGFFCGKNEYYYYTSEGLKIEELKNIARFDDLPSLKARVTFDVWGPYHVIPLLVVFFENNWADLRDKVQKLVDTLESFKENRGKAICFLRAFKETRREDAQIFYSKIIKILEEARNEINERPSFSKKKDLDLAILEELLKERGLEDNDVQSVKEIFASNEEVLSKETLNNNNILRFGYLTEDSKPSKSYVILSDKLKTLNL